MAEAFKGNEIMLLDAFSSCPGEEEQKFLKSTAKLVKEIASRNADLSKNEIFDALSYLTSLHYPVITFGEFIRKFDVSLETIAEFTELFSPQNYKTFSSKYTETIKGFYKLKQHLISKNFDPLSPFEDQVSEKFPALLLEKVCSDFGEKEGHLS